jgi:hypothetical protein
MMFLVSFTCPGKCTRADWPAFVQEEQAIESVDQSGAENVRVHWQVCLTRLMSTCALADVSVYQGQVYTYPATLEILTIRRNANFPRTKDARGDSTESREL